MRLVRPRHRAGQLLAAALIALPAGALLYPDQALAVGEVSGRLGGFVVLDATNDGMGAVQITVRSRALPGGSQTITTADDGSYQFPNLPPGRYELIAKIEGFAPVLQRNIQVLAGQLAAVDIRLVVQAEAPKDQPYIIREKTNPVLNQESAASVTNLNNQQISTIPTFRQFQSVAQLTPGVAQGSDRASARGGLGRFNRYLVDGLDTTDIVTGGITSPMNFDAVEQFTVYAGAMDAEFNSLGLVQNVVTRTGGNKLVIDSSVTLQPEAFFAGTRYAANSPLQDERLLYDDRNLPVRSFYSGNLNIGGPIVKDRLWFFTSFQFNINRRSTPMPALPFYPGYERAYDRYQDTYTYLGRAKLTWQATASTRLALSFNLDRNYIRNDSSSTSLFPEADRRTDRGGHWVVLLWDTLITSKLLFQMQAGFTHKFTTFDTMRQLPGQPGVADRITPAHSLRGGLFDGFTYNNSGGWEDESKINVQVNPSLLYNTTGLGGTHNIKGGVQFSYMRYDHAQGIAGGRSYTDNYTGDGTTAPTPCDATWLGDPNNPAAPPPLADASAGNPLAWRNCNQLREYPQSLPTRDANGNLVYGKGNETSAAAFNLGFFLQDRFTFKRWLTVVPGMRFDLGVLQDKDGKAVAQLFGYGPRLSVIYDLLHDRSTLITAHYGRHNDVGNAFIADRANPAQVSNFYAWDSAQSRFTYRNSSGGPGNQRFADSVSPPTLDEAAVGIKREVLSQTVIGVDYTYRAYRNFWVNEEINQLWDPSGLRVVGYVNGMPQRIFQASTPSDAGRDYHGVDFWVKGNPGNFNITASYTLAFVNGTSGDFFDGYRSNPRQNLLSFGPLSDNYRHYLKAIVDYMFDFGLTLGVRFQYLSGAPQWQSFSLPEDQSFSLYRTPRGTSAGTSTNNPLTWADFRLPDQVNVDAQASFNFEKLTGQRIDLYMMFFNVLNLGTATSLETRNNNNFGAVTRRLDPFFAQLVLRYRY